MGTKTSTSVPGSEFENLTSPFKYLIRFSILVRPNPFCFDELKSKPIPLSATIISYWSSILLKVIWTWLAFEWLRMLFTSSCIVRYSCTFWISVSWKSSVWSLIVISKLFLQVVGKGTKTTSFPSRVHVESGANDQGLDLVFRSIEPQDGGHYACEAVLDDEEEREEFELKVIGELLTHTAKYCFDIVNLFFQSQFSLTKPKRSSP